MKKTAVYALTRKGALLGKTLADHLKGDLFLPAPLAEAYGAIPFDRLLDVVAAGFSSYPRQVFITAAGIAVRAIASHLRGKDKDPAVVVIDQEGKYAVSLLSGHLGGANELAREVARLTGGDAVITTATDTAGVSSIDLLAKDRDIAIANIEAVKSINMAILEGVPVRIFDPEDCLGLREEKGREFPVEWVAEEEKWVHGHPGVWITWKRKTPDPGGEQLVLHPRRLIAGIGCNRGTASLEILDLITTTFMETGLAPESLKCLTTIEVKRDENGIIEAARKLGVPLLFLTSSEIKTVNVPHPSDIVKKHMGVTSVCEATALLKSKGGRLLVPKTKSRNATLAVALEN